MDDKPYRVLLVDDEAGIRKILRLFLEREGYEVHEAVSGAQAKQLIEEKKPHLILLDVILCGMTGFEVCEWIKKNPETEDIIVILFTALNQDYDYKEGQRVKCDYYLTKPQNPVDIIAKINEFLNNKHDKH